MKTINPEWVIGPFKDLDEMKRVWETLRDSGERMYRNEFTYKSPSLEKSFILCQTDKDWFASRIPIPNISPTEFLSIVHGQKTESEHKVREKRVKLCEGYGMSPLMVYEKLIEKGIDLTMPTYLANKLTPPEPEEWVRPDKLDLSLEYETRTGEYIGKVNIEESKLRGYPLKNGVFSWTKDGYHEKGRNRRMDLFPIGLGPNTKGRRSEEFNSVKEPDVKSCTSTCPNLFLDGHQPGCSNYVAPAQTSNVWGIPQPPKEPDYLTEGDKGDV